MFGKLQALEVVFDDSAIEVGMLGKLEFDRESEWHLVGKNNKDWSFFFVRAHPDTINVWVQVRKNDKAKVRKPERQEILSMSIENTS